MRVADDIFRSELERRGIAYSITPTGLYEVQVDDQTAMVSLENIRRNYDRDGDAYAIVRFVDQIHLEKDIPGWDDVRPYVRYSLEPSNYETGFDGVLLETISDELNKVFVYTLADGSRITWINESMLKDWAVTREQVVQQAEDNMAAIVEQTKFEVKEIDGMKLGMILTDETPFKASLILSRAFRHIVEPTHGWPVLAVVPCRDFAYIIREDDRELLSRLGRVVVDEYRNSGHPITRDVLLVADEGITATGTFPESE